MVLLSSRVQGRIHGKAIRATIISSRSRFNGDVARPVLWMNEPQNLMGDFVEGSGGLVLQVPLDRRVMMFGRGRPLLPEHLKRPGRRRELSEPGQAVGHARKPAKESTVRRQAKPG